MADSAHFICALRGAMSRISGVPLSRVTVVSVSEPATGVRHPVRAAQHSESCETRALAGSKSAHRVLQALGLTELEAEVELDAAHTTLTSVASNAAAAVRAALQATFSDQAAMDTAFAAVLQTACAAQGISSQSCPNPPSLVMRLASTPAPPDPAPSSILVIAAVAGSVAFGLTLVVSAAVVCVWWKKGSHSSATVRPEPSTVQLSVAAPVTSSEHSFLAPYPTAPPAEEPATHPDEHESVPAPSTATGSSV